MILINLKMPIRPDKMGQGDGLVSL